MLNTSSPDSARRFDLAFRPSAPDRVAVRFESDAALARGLALAHGAPWVAEYRIERATRTLHLRLCSGASTAGHRLH